MNSKNNNGSGSALILVVVAMMIIFITVTVSLSLSNYGVLSTNAHAKNINGYQLAEGGVFMAESLLNDMLRARIHVVSEQAFDQITSIAAEGLTVHEKNAPGTAGGVFHLIDENNLHILFDIFFSELIDGEVRAALMEAGGVYNFEYDFLLNDLYDSAYEIAVSVKYSSGGFDIISVAHNRGTGIKDTAEGRIEYFYKPVYELIYDPPGGGMISFETLTISDAGNFRYEIKSVKKAFV